MLHAAVVYVQGSAGNLLTRCLTLDPTTIPCTPEAQRYNQPTLCADISQRLSWHGNWNAHTWEQAEETIGFWCHAHDQVGPDFYEYADSSLKFIDHFHPAAFKLENSRELLWTAQDPWQHHVFITFEYTSLNDIIHFASAKRPNRENANYIQQVELPAYSELRLQYPQALEFPFECIFNFDEFYAELAKLAQPLDLHLDTDCVKLLWTQWNHAHIEVTTK